MFDRATNSAPDPFTLARAFSTFRPNTNVFGKTIHDPRLVPGESVGVFIIAGQSMGSNTTDTLYTPTNALKVDNLNVDDGGLYRAVDPLLGCESNADANKGNVFGRVADKLIDGDVFDRVILVPTCLGGSSIADWNDNESLWRRIVVADARAKARGLTPSGILWVQGERDNFLDTSQVDYQSRFASMSGKVIAAGVSCPWFIGVSTYFLGAQDNNVRAALAAIVNGSTFRAGADTDALTGANRYDTTHWTAAGADAAAALWKTAIDAVF